mmetsp:Transcript_27711/g.38540  ORF Transcript_27711/g.38540 Transcript_27711/m.38540 type:complete len:462 (-) Transcript_27711:74-1459(-)
MRSYRSHLESEAELLKKINLHQRTEENLNAAIAQKDEQIEQLTEALLAMETKLNATLHSDQERKKDSKEKKEEEDSSNSRSDAEKDIDEDQATNHTLHLLPNTLTREAAPVGIPVCIIDSKNNPKELQKSIESVVASIPSIGFPLFISQAGEDEEVTAVIKSFLRKDGERTNTFHLQYIEEKVNGAVGSVDSMHHYWALSMIFDKYAYSKAIVINSNLEVASDFFDYMQTSANFLDSDPSIICISAWNENGQEDFAKDSSALMRTDIFPDYGWMIQADFWRELKVGWPETDWQAWLKTREDNKGRACIIPEVCRVTVRKEADLTSADQKFYDQFIGKIKLNKTPVKFSSMDLDFLSKPNKYDSYIGSLIADSIPVASASALKDFRGKPGDIKLIYKETTEYVSTARIIGLIAKLEVGHPASSYHGIVIVRYGTWRLFIVPEDWESRLSIETKPKDEAEISN